MNLAAASVERTVRARLGWTLRSRYFALAPLVLLLVALSWPIKAGIAGGSLDPSWQAALHLAAQRHLDFGSEIIFTYGPLGFLGSPWPWYGGTTALAIVFAGVVYVALAIIVLAGALRALPLWAAALVAFLALRLVTSLTGFEALEAIVLSGCLVVLLRHERLAVGWIVAAGIVAALALLGKLNTGILIFGLLAVTVLALSGFRRGLGLYLMTVGVVGTTLWLVLGEPITGIVGYARWSLEIIRGYSEAMNVELTTTWHWFPFAFVAMVGLLTAYAWDEVRTVSRARRLALLVIMLVAAFGFYKSTIVRPHLGFAMGAVGVVLFALARPGTRQQFTFLFAAVVFAFMGISPRDPVVLLNPMPQLRAEAQQAAVLLRPWKWAAAESRTQAQLAAAYGIDPPILAAIGSASVHVDPQDTAVAAAYPELHWLPLPMFQSYSSYTSAMDNLNASVLSGPAAPQRILREAPHPFSARQPAVVTMTIDNRDRWFDGPAGMLQTFCRYDETAATARWEVLALNPTRTCGTPEPLGSVTAPLGSTVSVPTDPRPDRIVIVRVHGIDESPLDRVLSTLYHAPQWFVTINGADRYRLVPGTAVDGLIMSMPTSVVRSAGFAPDQVTSAAVSADTMLPWQGALTFEFLSVPLVGG